MPTEFGGIASMVASLFTFPLATTTAIFIYLYLRERKVVAEMTALAAAEAKKAAIDLSDERARRIEDARAYAKELGEERKARSTDAEKYTGFILDNQSATIQAVGKLEAVLDALGIERRHRGSRP